MMLVESTTLELMEKRLNWLSLKASVHSGNVSCSDIPERSRQKVVEFSDFLKQSSTDPSKNIKTTHEKTRKADEVLQMTLVKQDHGAVVRTMRAFYKMAESVNKLQTA